MGILLVLLQKFLFIIIQIGICVMQMDWETNSCLIYRQFMCLGMIGD